MLPTENEWNPLAKPSTLALTKRGLAPAESSTVALPTEEEVPTDEQTELNPREAPDDTEQEEVSVYIYNISVMRVFQKTNR